MQAGRVKPDKITEKQIRGHLYRGRARAHTGDHAGIEEMVDAMGQLRTCRRIGSGQQCAKSGCEQSQQSSLSIQSLTHGTWPTRRTVP